MPIIIGRCLEKYESLKESDLVDACESMVEAVVKIAKGDLDIQQVLENPALSEDPHNMSADLWEST